MKSITNTTQLAPSHSLNAQTAVSTAASTKSSADSNNTTSAALWSISLTPPTSSRPINRTNGSGGGHKSSKTQFQQAFDDDNSLFNQTSGVRLNNNNQNNVNSGSNSHNVFNGNGIGSSNGNANILNGINGQHVITKNSLNLQSTVSSNVDNNKFTPDADFVADFGSANIFNATAGSATSTVGNGMIAPPPAVNGHTAHQNGINTFLNGTTSTAGHNGQENGANGGSNANANFADFDHNPIYNAAGKSSSQV